MDEPWAAGPEEDELVIADSHVNHTPLFHSWFAVRPPVYALAAVTLTLDAEAEDRTALFAAITSLDYAHIRQQLQQNLFPSDGSLPREPLHVVDLCSGVGTMSAAASALGCQVTAIDNAPVPTLMNRLLHTYAVDGSVADADPTRGWNGLFSEMRAAVDTILRTISAVGGPTFDRIWVRSAACDACGLYIPMLRDLRVTRSQFLVVEFDADGPLPRLRVAPIAVTGAKGAAETGNGPYTRQGLTCPRCGHLSRTRPTESAIALPAANIGRPGTQASTVDDHNPRGIVPIEPPPALAASEPAELWGWSLRSEALVTLDAARTSHQQTYLDRLIDAVNQIGLDLAARPRLSDPQRRAVITGCALLVSAQSTIESTMASWSPIAGSSAVRLPAAQGLPALMFSENGAALRARLFQHRARLLLDRLRKVRDEIREPVGVRQGDAGDTRLPDLCADAVVWDPPIGDNIDYAAAAFPYEQTLSRILVPRDEDANVTTSLVPQPVLPRAALKHPTRADILESSTDGIRKQAAEARRLLRPDGRVGVYWYAPTSDALQEFLDLIAPSGLQLERAIAVRDPRLPAMGPAEERRTYLLILRSVTESAKATSSGIDVQTVLTRVEQDLPVLNEGLVAVLERHYDVEELEALVPPEFRGTINQRLVEYVASHPQPGSLLTELGRKALRARADRRGQSFQRLAQVTSLMVRMRVIARAIWARRCSG
jgi:hypothetical protein